MKCDPAAGGAGAPPLPRVLHLASRRIVRPLLGDGAAFQDRLDWLTGEIGDQLAGALAQPADTPPLNLMCTTTLTKMISGWEGNARRLFDRVQARAGLRPAGLLEGYQCAGWGYALRFAATQTRRRRLVLSIVDADLHDIMGPGYEDAVGAIGFGITTVALDLAGTPQLPLCAGPAPNHGFTDLLHAVRAHHRHTGPRPTFMPFLPDGLAAIARRTLGETLGPNRHGHYGHTFGSDPWIGLAEWLRAQPPAADQPVTLGAFAYDGYYTVGSVCVGPWTQVDLRADQPAAPALPQATEGRLQ
jgi:hypothetical protein